MTKLRKSIAFTLFAFATIMLLPTCQVGRFVYYNFAGIEDYKIFPSRTIANSGEKFFFQKATNPKFPKTTTVNGKQKTLDEYLSENKTVAFLIIKNDSIQYEKYFAGYDKQSIVPSFSMAKSVNSILIGCAIDDGLILSVDEPVTKYIPEMAKNGFEKVTIKHLLQMTSGIKFNESYYNPFGDAASFYYGFNLPKQISKMTLKNEPGTKFEYSSGDSQVLGLVLERALKGKKISVYLQEKIWQPLGMEFDATWSLDQEQNGLEKTFCCLNARARDFAKIGRLYKNKGNWNGKQIVSEKWVETSTTPDATAGGVNYYKYQWWLPTSSTTDFMAVGILGQYVYVSPEKNLIIVRLGRNYGNVDWNRFFVNVAKGY